MKHIRTCACLYMLAIFFSLFIAEKESSAQMTIGYPRRFHLTGLLELQYRYYSNETSTPRASHRSSYSSLKERVRLNLDGYIYHPRLIVFDTSVDFSYSKSLTGVDIEGRDLGYDIFVTVLPYRPISLELFGSRNHYHFEARTQALPDRTVNHYGARMRINMEKLKPIRLIRLRYEHWDYVTEGVSEDTKTDTYSLSINGLLTGLRTNYIVTSTYTNFTSPIIDIDTKYFTAFTDTGLTKKGTELITSFFYSDLEDSIDNYIKETSFSADLDFPPGERFYHDYRYIFDKTEYFYKGSLAAGTEDRLAKTSYHTLTGSWGYRFTDRLTGSLYLDYGKRKSDGTRGDVTGLSTNIAYRRPLAGFNYESDYRFIMRRDDIEGDFNEHYVNVSLKTRRFRLGTAYLTYNFIKSDSKSNVFEESEDEFVEEEEILIGERTSDTTSHTILLGLRGRGFGSVLRRALWTVEASYLNVSSDIKRPIRVFNDETLETEIQIEHITRNAYQYSIYSQIDLPIRTTMNFNSRATYAYGETDSVSRKLFVIHGRLNYRVYRNLVFSGLVRSRWERIENSPNRNITDYEAVLDYRRGKILLTFEFYLTSTQQADIDYWSNRIFVTLRRFI